jgi:predicted Rossmann-fold nucleotide-binding protein
MVKIPTHGPDHWRKCAEEARALAGELTDLHAKRRMLKVVEDYEKLAKRAERRLRERENL